MKKIIALVFACSFAAALVSCGQKAENADTASDTTTVIESAPVIEDNVADSAAVVPVDTTVAK